ncbi:MAG TPA: 50S ribosomal protein L11 methyltransferase [Hellea balneolensis]|uniref:Ribosomal protein L11 methyltransferase n=1 Tax=Hellea balneolensis TaxID=287478 RepID=A0A7C5QUN5_9PROT|nr:50S ribosomal protein L11 methyltransferase [Hellea balneolensis]
MTLTRPFALIIRGPRELIFALSDQLGFDAHMQALAVSVFEDGPKNWLVQALFEAKQDALECLSRLDVAKLETSITQLPETDWVAKTQAGLPPVTAGRFFIHGAHDRDKIPMGTPYPIEINAGMAFGTGHHGTTKGCLLALESLIWQPPSSVKKPLKNYPKNVLDLGCGSGVLAIAAAKAVNIDVVASDIDPDAVSVTLENAELNGVKGRITAITADGIPPHPKTEEGYNLIFANILAGPLIGLAPAIARVTQDQGHVILSGLLDEQANKVLTAYQPMGYELVRQSSHEGWATLTIKKTGV